jgi:biopolymer transport protein ExbD
MSIEVTCVQCGTSHHVNDRLAGRRVRCPSCDTAVHVPEAVVQAHAVEPSESTEAEAVVVEELPVEVVAVEAAPRKIAVAESTIAANPVQPNDDDEDDQVLERSERPEEEMDMTPMVDVTFLLLIFFMVTAAFSLQKSIKMPRQQTDAPSTAAVEQETEELDQVEVQVDEFGSFLVLGPDWERETPGKQNLVSALKEAMAGRSDGMKLIVKVHEMAKLNALVDAMDAGAIAGYTELQVTQVEEFD